MSNRKISILGMIAMVFILASCGKQESGQLIGVQDRPSWGGLNPYGMVYVPSGSLTVGQSDQDIFNTYSQRQRTISLQGFYMDETEITNNEYRQFVYWVRDSIAHVMMDDIETDDYGNDRIIWDYELDYGSEELDDMFYQGDMAFDGKRSLNVSKMKYAYTTIDWNKAARTKGYDNNVRTQLLQKEEINIYPDTLCWVRDFGYSYNEPFMRNYFSHPAFDDYPVVGVDWNQANAFCNWRTQYWNTYKGEDEPNTEEFRLPTEAEWEHAARGGAALAPYPWGGYNIRNTKGCLLANFKPGRGNYPEDGGLYTVKADEYYPNPYGLYNMAGNVSEWTENSYNESAYNLEWDLNPAYTYDAGDDDPEAFKRKIIRGGSWKDVAHYLQNGTRHWEFQDTSKSYIGFRCAVTFLGRSINDF